MPTTGGQQPASTGTALSVASHQAVPALNHFTQHDDHHPESLGALAADAVLDPCPSSESGEDVSKDCLMPTTGPLEVSGASLTKSIEFG